MRTSHILRGHLRLFAPWLAQITSANVLDREIADAFVSRFHELADELDVSAAEAHAADLHPGPRVRAAIVPGVAAPRPASPIGAEIVPLFPRVQE